MRVVERWSGRHAAALRAALRMSSEAFAEHLGAAVRTVKYWNAKPDAVPSGAMQEVLDAALEQTSAQVRNRFALLLTDGVDPADGVPAEADATAALTISIAVILRDAEVLLVKRRDADNAGIAWQFPAGIVKPGYDPAVVATNETLAETGVHSNVVEHLGKRRHPVTNALCHYFHCEYLAGDARNLDAGENASVVWALRTDIGKYIPAEMIYPAVLQKLNEEELGSGDY